MRRYGYSRPALVVGFVLADGIATNLCQIVNFYGLDVFTRPIFLVLLALAGICVYYGMKLTKAQKQEANMALLRLGAAKPTSMGLSAASAGLALPFRRTLKRER